MKASLRLLILFCFPTIICADDSAFTCSMGDYDFTGTYQSDSYKRPETKGQESCKQRESMDSNKIGKDYKENHKKIRDQIQKMMNDPRCVPLQPVLTDYLEKYQKNEQSFDDLTKVRTQFVAEKIKEHDVQKAYAYAGAFNGTCSGGHNRKTSFINLEFVNRLSQTDGTPAQVTKEGEQVDSCADVSAGGSDDLKSFFVSTKNAKGKEFVFTWDPFGVPDQVIVKSKSGQLIYDSGCKGAKTQPPPIKLPLPKEGMVINVINTCENPSEKASSWNLRIQCSETSEICKEPRDELTRLVMEEVRQTKELLNANKLQQQCYFYIDKDLLGELLKDGMITEEDGPKTNGLCDVMNDACNGNINANQAGEKGKASRASAGSGTGSVTGAAGGVNSDASAASHSQSLSGTGLIPYREPSQEQFSCPEHHEVKDSLFKTVSYAYCKVGWKKLGLIENVPE